MDGLWVMTTGDLRGVQDGGFNLCVAPSLGNRCLVFGITDSDGRA